MARRQVVLPKASLIERREITDDLMIIKIRPEPAMDFKPGQYCTLGLEGIERAYSIVSAPYEAELEIFVELVPEPDGALTPLIWKMKEGDVMTIRPRCKGIFTLNQKYNSHLMVATVTGVAPFMSILRNYFHDGSEGHRFHVLEGASYSDELVYDRELFDMERKHPDTLRFVPTVSRPKEEENAGWQGETGRVNEIVESYAEKMVLRPEATLVYACGHPGMIEDVKERMAPKGFKVKEERFWKQ
jgi:ferredoxin--NADP+ reductase